MKYLSRDIRSRALHEVALPIPFDAAAMPGARVLGDDGREYVSIRWPEVSDTYQWVSAAQIAEDVAADVARLAPPDLLVRVGPGPVLEGERYPSLSQAYKYMASFISSYNPGVELLRPSPWLLIESGVVIEEQIELVGIRLGDVVLASEDEIVYYDRAALTRMNSSASEEGQVHNFMRHVGGSTPIFSGVRFQPLADSVTPQDPAIVDLLGGPYTPKVRGLLTTSGCVSVITGIRRDAEGNTLPARRLAGFENADFNFRNSSTDTVRLDGAIFDDAVEVGARIGGTALIAGSVARGCGTHGLRLGGVINMPSVNAGPDALGPGIFGHDYRNTAGVDHPDDIRIDAGAQVFIGSSAANFRGGVSQPFNTFTSQGAVFRPSMANRTYNRDNILGTVSFASGAVTGAAMQSGFVSGQGWFERHANGVQKCWQILDLGSITANGTGTRDDPYHSDGLNWVFPIAFFETPVVITQAGVPDVAFNRRIASAAVFSTSATTTFGIRAFRLSDNGTSDSARVVVQAIGRWRAV
jgi:hypothetical protein